MEKQYNNTDKQNNFQWIWLGLISLIVFVSTTVFVIIVAIRDLSSMENVLLQFIFLSIGCGVSYIVGKQSVEKARDEFLKPHARSAVRYLVSLYKSITRAAEVTESTQNFKSPENYNVIRAYLLGIFGEQLASADDAIENWRDILKEELEDMIIKSEEEDRFTPKRTEDLMQKLVHENTLEDK
ncbi:hypothetical protein C6497_07135 [Candidatus Poribacteria bacterium]|nr:MAG: hypothetical protein C6497_07135 [Candidatus Poribacteria bacterium]